MCAQTAGIPASCSRIGLSLPVRHCRQMPSIRRCRAWACIETTWSRCSGLSSCPHSHTNKHTISTASHCPRMPRLPSCTPYREAPHSSSAVFGTKDPDCSCSYGSGCGWLPSIFRWNYMSSLNLALVQSWLSDKLIQLVTRRPAHLACHSPAMSVWEFVRPPTKSPFIILLSKTPPLQDTTPHTYTKEPGAYDG